MKRTIKAAFVIFTILVPITSIGQFHKALSPDTSLLKKPIIPINFYHINTGTICKTELRFQKVSRVPLFFRLGNMEYCNKLEGK
jgi:hypothetical protein